MPIGRQDVTSKMKPISSQYGLLQKAAIGVQKAVGYLNSKILGIEQDSWFSPGQPLQATPGKADPGRVLDYPTNWNLNYIPRGTEGVTFEQLINLSNIHPLLRLIIETRKDQIAKLPWDIQFIDKDNESKDSAIDDVKDFLRFPDRNREHPFHTWLRMILEDCLVIDAASIFIHPTLGGSPYALRPLDGSTIHPLLDDIGSRPMQGPAYQQIIKGTPKFYYTMDQLVYRPRVVKTNKVYGMSPVEQIVMTVNLALRRDTSKLDWYTTGNIPEGFLMMPPAMTADEIEEFYKRFNAMLSGNQANRAKIIPIPGDGTDRANIVFPKEFILKDEADEWIARVMCFAFSISPTPFIKMVNRSTAQSLADSAMEEGLYPMMAWIKSLMDHFIQENFGFKKFEFVWTHAKKIDPLVQAQRDKIELESGKVSVDELRKRDGQKPIGLSHFIRVPNGVIFVNGPLHTVEGILAPVSAPTQGGTDEEGNPIEASQTTTEEGKLRAGERADVITSAGEETSTKEGEETLSEAVKSTSLQKKKSRRTLKRVTFQSEADVLAYANILKHFFKSQGTKIAKQVSRAYAKKSDLKKASDSEITDEIDFSAWDFLFAPSKKQLNKVGSSAGDRTLKSIGIKYDDDVFKLVNDDALAYAETRAAEMVGKKIVDGELVDNPDAKWVITDSTRDMIQSDVTKAVEEGWGAQKLADEIEANNAFSETRAYNIAKTELSNAHSQGARDGWKRSGVVVKRHSLVSSDHEIPDVCDDNEDAGDIDLNEAYPSGAERPPFHVGCNCDEVAVVDTEASSEVESDDVE